MTCTGCIYDIPGDCAKREVVNGWLKFPEGDCYEIAPAKPEPPVHLVLELVRIVNGERARV